MPINALSLPRSQIPSLLYPSPFVYINHPLVTMRLLLFLLHVLHFLVFCAAAEDESTVTITVPALGMPLSSTLGASIVDFNKGTVTYTLNYTFPVQNVFTYDPSTVIGSQFFSEQTQVSPSPFILAGC